MARRPGRSGARALRAFTLALVLVVLAAIGAIVWAFLPADRKAGPVLVEIPERSSVRTIGEKLKASGIIRSEIAFLLMARMLGESSHMQAGDFQLSGRMTLAQIINKLSRGESLARWITVPEGYTVRQIAALFSSEGLADAGRFQRIAHGGGRSFRRLSFDPPSNLEGYLFPDTYKFQSRTTERQILREMLDDFDRKVARPYRADFRATASAGRSMGEVLILASMVEREAKARREQPIIAGVMLNRLRIGMRLQVDATVQFALAAPKRRLLYKDLAVASPYNTYLVPGLPLGPICSPGLNAIRAALHPARADSLLYYVARPDGTHIFSRTLQEHDAARARVRELAKRSP